MNKGEILKQLNEIQHELTNQKDKLDNLLSTPIWSEIVHDELDETVDLRHELAERIYDLMDIQRKIILKPKN
jgi:hypothetical protein